MVESFAAILTEKQRKSYVVMEDLMNLFDAFNEADIKALKQVLDVERKRIEKLETVVQKLERENAELRSQIITADARELLQVKINELQRQADAHRKHLQNLESKISKATSGLKGFNE